MSETTWTPGPWELAPYSDGDELVNVVKDYKTVPGGCQAHWIAELDAQIDLDTDRDAQLDEMYANARLITAAPELYQACRAFIEAWERSLQLEKTDDALRLAKAALKKADGR